MLMPPIWLLMSLIGGPCRPGMGEPSPLTSSLPLIPGSGVVSSKPSDEALDEKSPLSLGLALVGGGGCMPLVTAEEEFALRDGKESDC
jgi:hypothetical protein